MISNQSIKQLHAKSTKTSQNKVKFLPSVTATVMPMFPFLTYRTAKKLTLPAQPPQVKSNPIMAISACLSNLFLKLLGIIHHGGRKG